MDDGFEQGCKKQFSTGKGLGLCALKAREVQAYTQTYGHALWEYVKSS